MARSSLIARPGVVVCVGVEAGFAIGATWVQADMNSAYSSNRRSPFIFNLHYTLTLTSSDRKILVAVKNRCELLPDRHAQEVGPDDQAHYPLPPHQVGKSGRE